MSLEGQKTEVTENTGEVIDTQPIETMDDYKEELEQSYKKINAGDLLRGIIAGKSDTEVSVDLGLHSEGIIPLAELSFDPQFSINSDINAGDPVAVVVIKEDDGQGNILLSKKQADNILAWEALKEMQDNETVVNVKISGVVNGGVIVYVNGIRGFIPASQLSISYAPDLNEWLHKTVDAKIITIDEKKRRLVLSSKAVALEKANADKAARISSINVGDVFEGKVDKNTTYGAFIDLGDGLSGLVHISQISQKHIKSPNEVIKEGDAVKVKVIAIKEGKLSLSMKALQEVDEARGFAKEKFNYKADGEATTGLKSLLSGIKLD